MITASWIAGLMRENSDELGFIPEPTIDHRYIRLGRFITQEDEHGANIGYLLHGAIVPGRIVTIAQHCIQIEKRMRGYGEQTVRSLIERAEYQQVSGIALRCAADLEAIRFWSKLGFQMLGMVPGGEKHRPGRAIARLWLPLSLPLIERAAIDAARGET